jgi:hypothetical protein
MPGRRGATTRTEKKQGPFTREGWLSLERALSASTQREGLVATSRSSPTKREYRRLDQRMLGVVDNLRTLDHLDPETVEGLVSLLREWWRALELRRVVRPQKVPWELSSESPFESLTLESAHHRSESPPWDSPRCLSLVRTSWYPRGRTGHGGVDVVGEPNACGLARPKEEGPHCPWWLPWRRN